jgi:hypothetical protein
MQLHSGEVLNSVHAVIGVKGHCAGKSEATLILLSFCNAGMRR